MSRRVATSAVVRLLFLAVLCSSFRVALADQPPTVSITAPATGSQFAFLSPITFQATATDPEGGTVSTIAWRSSQSGNDIIGWGSPMTTSSLSPGTHVITASSNDAGGLTGQASITITVGSPTVAYCDVRGGNSNYEWIQSVNVGSYTKVSGNNGGYGNFTSEAPISLVVGSNGINLTPGGSYSENWTIWIDFNGDGRFDGNEQVFNVGGYGAMSGTITIPSSAPKGKTRMRVVMSYGTSAQACGTFGYGEAEDYVVDIGGTVTPPPPTASYCPSKGSTASYEWIKEITLAGVTRTTGQNGGYGNFTSQPAIALARGSNALSVTPGFGYALYNEYWRAWIDFNHDGIFADNEIVYSGASQAPLSGSITVPTTALSGPTRMRVSMKYGYWPTSCETFSYGEVEDHAVTIP